MLVHALQLTAEGEFLHRDHGTVQFYNNVYAGGIFLYCHAEVISHSVETE